MGFRVFGHGMAWRLQQVRSRMSWARKQRDRELWDALNEMKDELDHKKMIYRRNLKREVRKFWPEKHLRYFPENALQLRFCDDTKLILTSIADGWRRGIPPDRSLAWYVAQRRPINPIMVSAVLHRLDKPYIAFEFFKWAAKLPNFQHDAVTCAMLFRCYFLGNCPDSALSFFKNEVPGLCEPSELLYNVLIQGLFISGMPQEAIGLYDEMTGVCSVPCPGRATEAILKEGLVRNGLPIEEYTRLFKYSSDTQPERLRTTKGIRLKRRRPKFKTPLPTQKELILRCRKSPILHMNPPRWKAERYPRLRRRRDDKESSQV